MAIGTLGAIINKVRLLACAGNSFQLTDAQIIDYINSFYLYDFPAQFRSLKLKDRYTFNTIRGIDCYPFDSEHYSTVEAPCSCMKRPLILMQDCWSFYGLNYNWQYQNNFTKGNGTSGPYVGTATPNGITNPNVVIIRSQNNNPRISTPLNPTTSFPSGYPVIFPDANISRVQNILITASTSAGITQNVTDDGNGNLIGDVDSVTLPVTNTINYVTGAISLRFSQLVPAGFPIQIQFNPVQMTIPLAILFFQNQFTLRPVPDKGYTIELTAYRLPSQALLGSGTVLNTNGVPEQLEWWETLAFGATKKFFEDNGDADGIAFMDKSLAERYSLNMSRVYGQISTQRIATPFSGQVDNTHGSYGYGWGWNNNAGT